MLRFGPGPVCRAELLRVSRRWQTYFLRSLFIAAMLAAMTAFGLVKSRSLTGGNTRQLAAIGKDLFVIAAFSQLGLALLLAAANSAGALIPDRNTGSLHHVLLTDLSVWEIVFEKYVGRTLPLLMMLASSLPVMLLLILLGGIHPNQVAGLHLLIGGYILAIPAICMAASLWMRRTADLLAWALVLILLWSMLPFFAALMNRGMGGSLPMAEHSPFYRLTAIASTSDWEMTKQTAREFCCLAAIAGAFLAWTSLHLRKSSEPPAATSVRRIRSRRPTVPEIEARPVLWLEWARNRRGVVEKLMKAVLFVGAAIAYAMLIANLFASTVTGRVMPCFLLAFVLTTSQLLACVVILGRIAEDRQTRQLQMLGLTPLEAREVISDKVAVARMVLQSTIWVGACFAALNVVRDPTTACLGVLLMAAFLTSIARFIASYSNWLGLRISKPANALTIGVATITGCNLVPFLFGLSLGPSSGGIFFIQSSPFGGLICGMATSVDRDFFPREFGVGNLIVMIVGAACLVGLARFLDRESETWMTVRMRGENG